MRGLMRNKRPIYYKNFLRTEYLEDDQNRKTGAKKVVYSDVKTVYGTVSTPTGKTGLEMPGTDLNYDKIIVLDMIMTDITENSVFWLDKPYSADEAHDYIVTRILKNINYMTIGVRKVDAKNGKTNQSQANS